MPSDGASSRILQISRRGLQFDEALLMGSNQQFLAARHPELIENARQVVANGRGTDVETVGYIFVGESLRD